MKNKSFHTSAGFILLFILSVLRLPAQQYDAGQTYFGTNQYIEYLAGELPIVITAPHGGYLEPTSIPDRDCSGCSYARDTYTQELARTLAEALEARTGCLPHLVINRLHRKKLDANREIMEAADGDPQAEIAWTEWHHFIESAQAQALQRFGKGFYIDLHGHGHDIQRLELGYLLTSSELRLSDSALTARQLLSESSIRTLAGNAPQGMTFPELLRGPNSFGGLLEARGYPSVPAPAMPFPTTAEPYFNGGYNTGRYCSRDGDAFDGLQIECNWIGVRDNAANRQRFADSLTSALMTFLEMYYFGDVSTSLCMQSGASATTPEFHVYPNPRCDRFYAEQHDPTGATWQLAVYDFFGQILIQDELPANETLEIPLKYQRDCLVVLRRNGQVIRSQMLFYCR